jgi:hypothetical protein
MCLFAEGVSKLSEKFFAEFSENSGSIQRDLAKLLWHEPAKESKSWQLS